MERRGPERVAGWGICVPRTQKPSIVFQASQPARIDESSIPVQSLTDLSILSRDKQSSERAFWTRTNLPMNVTQVRLFAGLNQRQSAVPG